MVVCWIASKRSQRTPKSVAFWRPVTPNVSRLTPAGPHFSLIHLNICSCCDASARCFRYYVAFARPSQIKILDSVKIANPNLNLPLGLKFGMPRSNIERLLGSSDLSNRNSITYFAPAGEAGGSDGVAFISEQDKLTTLGVGFHYE